MTTYNRKTTDLALCVQVVDNYGTLRIEAHPVHVQPNGELHNVSWQYSGDTPGAFLDGFVVGCYLGSIAGSSPLEAERGTWGFGRHYAPHRIERTLHAKAIADTMTRLDKGMAALCDSDGYLVDTEFYRYVMRAAKVLKLPSVYVRNLRRTFHTTGARYRKVDAPGLQSWVDSVVEAHQKGERNQLFAA